MAALAATALPANLRNFGGAPSRGPYWASGRMPKRVRDEQSPSGWSEVPWHTCCDPVILAAPYVIDLHHDTVARVINSRTLQRSCTNTWRRTPVLSIQLGCGSNTTP